ncbi:MAG TPA: SRPBCC family protein [Acidimicrobiales bacterium]|nr:SRPBCC family protein [Acidimicrobiales bacterium]
MEVTATKTGSRVKVTFERRLAQPVDKVWRAITERDQLNQWFPSDVGVDVIGPDTKELHFTFRENEGPAGDGVVLEYDEPRLLVMDWYDGILRFELTPIDDGRGTLLRFSHDVEDDGERPTRDSAGWHVCLEQLDALVAGVPLPALTEDRWKSIEPEYAERVKQL